MSARGQSTGRESPLGGGSPTLPSPDLARVAVVSPTGFTHVRESTADSDEGPRSIRTPERPLGLFRQPTSDAFHATPEVQAWARGEAPRNVVGMAVELPEDGRGGRMGAFGRRSGPLLRPHASSLDLPRKYGGKAIFDMHALTYVFDTDPNLLCPICHDPLVDPVSTPCDHTFCYRCLRRCIVTSPAGSACPIDREPLSWLDCFTSARLTRTQLNNLAVFCPHRARGCHLELRREAVEKHATVDCPWREVPCPDPDCERMLQWKGRSGGCPHRIIRCGRCNAMVEEVDREAHLLTCVKSKTRCLGCWELISRSHVDTHYLVECDGVEMACPYEDVGCPERAVRAEICRHARACAFHPDTASGIVIRVLRESLHSSEIAAAKLKMMETRQDDTNRRIDELVAALTTTTTTTTLGGGGGGGSRLAADDRTAQDLEKVHQNLSHLEARQSMWIINQVMPIREDVTELRNSINMIRMHVNWLLNRSREEGRMRAANTTVPVNTLRRDGISEGGSRMPGRRRSSGAETDLSRL
ncbi:TRAF-like signal transducer [Drechmeria coniospora]|uniref:TRAF-like signal transducer n=1 Tax=Drechmeria coniospora TaxID=98403 RepID=A0A151GGA3_DRECN|nr:TRAF-like signal transducer [Drechmeria coniospora]KYK56130.1 TRAF-like signal transducer [Drechmeria coniospora]